MVSSQCRNPIKEYSSYKDKGRLTEPDRETKHTLSDAHRGRYIYGIKVYE